MISKDAYKVCFNIVNKCDYIFYKNKYFYSKKIIRTDSEKILYTYNNKCKI